VEHRHADVVDLRILDDLAMELVDLCLPSEQGLRRGHAGGNYIIWHEFFDLSVEVRTAGFDLGGGGSAVIRGAAFDQIGDMSLLGEAIALQLRANDPTTITNEWSTFAVLVLTWGFSDQEDLDVLGRLWTITTHAYRVSGCVEATISAMGVEAGHLSVEPLISVVRSSQSIRGKLVW